VMRFIAGEAAFDPGKIRKHAETFSKLAFQRTIAAFVREAFAKHRASQQIDA